VRLFFIVIGCLLACLAVAQRDERPQAQQISTSLQRADFVQVEHRVLTVEPVPTLRGRVVRAAQKPRPVTQSATPRRPLLARARQLVLGDGRLRPQPFPQPAVR
jgi:hypothetical protein